MNRVRNRWRYGLCLALLFCLGCEPMYDPANYSVVSIIFLESEYYRRPQPVTWPWRIQGTVTSSDEFGNFYKCIIIEDETAAIELKLNSTELYTKFPLGCKVDVLVSFLWLGTYGYNAVLGVEPHDESEEVGNIPYRDIDNIIRVIANDNTARPTPKEIDELNNGDNQKWVIFDSVQFINEEVGRTWADRDSLQTYRYLIDTRGNKLRVYTSGYATYGDTKIPSGSGTIDGIIYYRKDGLELRPISAIRAKMTNPRF